MRIWHGLLYALGMMLTLLLLVGCGTPAAAPTGQDAQAALTTAPQSTSSLEPTETSVEKEVTVIEVYCVYPRLTAKAWLDENRNSVWDTGEQPMANVRFFLDDLLGHQKMADHAVSDPNGSAEMEPMTMSDKDCSYLVEIYALVPDGYEPTTPERQRMDSDTLLFGFAPLPGVTHTPGPTTTPRPTAPISCTYYTIPTDYPDSVAVSDIEFAADGTTWITFSREGQGCYAQINPGESTTPLPINLIQVPGTEYAEAVAPAPDGVWFATKAGAGQLVGSSWKTHRKVFSKWNSVVAHSTLDVVLAPDNTLWFGTFDGVYQYDPDQDLWTDFSVYDEWKMPVRRILVSSEGNLWALRELGISRYRFPQGTTGEPQISTLGFQGFDLVVSGAVGPDDALWLEGSGPADAYGNRESVIARFDPSTEEWRIYTYATTEGAMLYGRVTGLAVAVDGSVWIGTEEKGVMHLIPGGGDTDPDVWIVYTSEDGLPADSIDHIAVESEDAVWVASGTKIARCTVGERVE